MRIKSIVLIFVSNTLFLFSCLSQSDEIYPHDYHSPTFKNELLIVNSDTLDHVPTNNDEEFVILSDSSFYLSHLNIILVITDTVPPLDDTYYWSDTGNAVVVFRYMSKKIDKYSVAITRIPYNSKVTGPIPTLKHELVDSVAFHIECLWNENRYYNGEVHALKYIVYYASSSD